MRGGQASNVLIGKLARANTLRAIVEPCRIGRGLPCVGSGGRGRTIPGADLRLLSSNRAEDRREWQGLFLRGAAKLCVVATAKGPGQPPGQK